LSFNKKLAITVGATASLNLGNAYVVYNGVSWNSVKPNYS